MGKIVLVPFLLVGLIGCSSRTVVERPVVVQPPTTASTVVVPSAGATVICPNGTQVPYGSHCDDDD